MLMAGYEGRYDRWSIILDFVYLDAGDSADTATGAGTASVDLNVSSYLVNGGIGYDFVQSDRAVAGVVGGVRYLSLDVGYDASVRGLKLSHLRKQITSPMGSSACEGRSNSMTNGSCPITQISARAAQT
jgi:hypothetical protein